MYAVHVIMEFDVIEYFEALYESYALTIIESTTCNRENIQGL